MSTILKALKKLEKGKDDFKAGGMPTGYMGPGSPNLKARSGISRWIGPTLRRILILVLVIGLGGAAFHFYRQAHNVQPSFVPDMAQKVPAPEPAPAPKPAPAPEPAPSAKAVPLPQAKPPAVVSAEPGRTPEPPAPPPPSDTPRSLKVEQALAPKNTRSFKDLPPTDSAGPASDRQAAEPPVPAIAQNQVRTDAAPASKPLNPGSQNQPAAGAPGPTPSVPPAPSPAPTVSPKPSNAPVPTRPPASAPTPIQTPPASPNPAPTASPSPAPAPARQPDAPREDPYKDVATLTDGRLQVQAIVWSPIAEDRMAVINTQIVHEGDKLEGFLITAIRNDDVVVREKGEYYRVKFGRP